MKTTLKQKFIIIIGIIFSIGVALAGFFLYTNKNGKDNLPIEEVIGPDEKSLFDTLSKNTVDHEKLSSDIAEQKDEIIKKEIRLSKKTIRVNKDTVLSEIDKLDDELFKP